MTHFYGYEVPEKEKKVYQLRGGTKIKGAMTTTPEGFVKDSCESFCRPRLKGINLLFGGTLEFKIRMSFHFLSPLLIAIYCSKPFILPEYLTTDSKNEL